jgi:hypothetical protein|tara:strand:- start:525 stop:1934 length:1410 start_codon:yes stop_codon:yes gene_type:complete
MSPTEPIGIKSYLVATVDTGGNCLDLDVDIADSIVVAAANYNGYFIYKLIFENDKISDMTEYAHISADDMDNSLGDNQAQTVVLSKNHNIAFVMDQYDHIWLNKYEEGATQYGPPNYLEEDCYGGTWLSVAIDDQSDRIGIYSLLKHNAAEFMPYCILESDLVDLGNLGTDQGCSDIEEYIATEYNNQTSCVAVAGYNWMYPGCQVGNYAEYSTSLVWKNLEEVDPSSTSLNGDPDCEYIINQGVIAEKIYFSDGLLIQAHGELGVRIFNQAYEAICLSDNQLIELEGNEECNNHLSPTGEIEYQSCCENIPCPDAWGEDCGSNDFYIQQFGYPGLGGVFSSEGGILPTVFAEFDTPGEVEAIYSEGNIIFTGLSLSNGCYMVNIDNDGNIVGTTQFAEGYTIKGIHAENGLLALAAGHDGIILYDWDGGYNVSFLGRLETAYANQVKVANNTIIGATEDGIEIIQIER